MRTTIWNHARIDKEALNFYRHLRRAGDLRRIICAREEGFVVIDGGISICPQNSRFGYLAMLPIGGYVREQFTLPSIVMGLRVIIFVL